jgi:D-glycero-alpha-D-manno-heptose-7-phosphate kinase
MVSFVGEAPTRVDLAGGTLDLWPIHHLLDNGCTVNFGVTVSARIEIQFSKDAKYLIASEDQKVSQRGTFSELIEKSSLPLITQFLRYFWRAEYQPLEIRVSAKSPAGAGLGGSSCLAVTLAGLLNHVRSRFGYAQLLGEHDLVESARDIEARLIEIPTGVQDYWGALRGGANILQFGPGRPVIETLRNDVPKQLTDDLILVYSGKSRASAGNNWQIFKAFFDGDKRIRKIFQSIAELSGLCAAALRKGEFSELIDASQREWALRTQLWPEIETKETQRISNAAREHGAYFSRICGAGGGGVMAVFTIPERRNAVVKAVSEAGGELLSAEFSKCGLRIEERL